MTGVADRNLEAIRLPEWGRVTGADGLVPWLVVDDDGVAIEPIRVFLRDFVARGNRPGSVRNYAFVLLRWCVGSELLHRMRPGNLGRDPRHGAVASVDDQTASGAAHGIVHRCWNGQHGDRETPPRRSLLSADRSAQQLGGRQLLRVLDRGPVGTSGQSGQQTAGEWASLQRWTQSDAAVSSGGKAPIQPEDSTTAATKH